MNFRFRSSDGPAQCGMLSIGKYTVEIPNLFFWNTNRFQAPAFSNMILTKMYQPFNAPQFNVELFEFLELQLERTDGNLGHTSSLILPKDPLESIFQWIRKTWPSDMKNCVLLSGENEFIEHIDYNKCEKFYVINSALQLYQNPKEFIKHILRINESLAYDSIIYLPSVAQPVNIALLVYCGIDVLDTIQAVLAARNNIMLFPTGNIKVKELKNVPCFCPSCSKITDLSGLNFSHILEHNYYMMYQEMQLVRNAIAQENLRRLVDLRVGTSPHLICHLRFLQQDGDKFLEKRTSLFQRKTLYVTTLESAHRSEIIRFQDRVLNRYHKPSSANVLLLLPCSMKKPYSLSQSHRKFRDAIFSSKNPYCVHELILTSPIGLVPRELEYIYPASNYDIPVTGTWYADERCQIQYLLRAYLKKNRYDKIIVHLSEEMTSFIKDVIPNGIFVTITGSPSSAEAVEQLSTIIERETVSIPKVSGKKRWFENLLSLASYQFTLPLADSLLKDCTVTGKYPYLKIIDSSGVQLAMTTERRGFFSLTLAGGKRLLSHNKYVVYLSNDFVLKGSVFVPGILTADSTIRRGDEVLLIQEKELRAVGVALMNGEEMMKRSRGEAVKIRHKAD